MRKLIADKRRSEAMSRNELLRQNVVVIDYTEYLQAASQRVDLPEYVMLRIQECVSEIRERYPDVGGVYLIGSYSNGTYVDEYTSDEFKALKEAVGKKVKISDFDFETVPFHTGFFETKSGYKVHLWKDREGSKVKVQ